MANPQTGNGYTGIANEILEHLIQIHLSPNQWQVILCIFRKTYGYHKKVDYIANFQISEATGLHKSHVSRALCLLEMMNLITRKGKYIGFQKDWEQWRKLSKLVINKKLPITATLNTDLPKQVTSEKLPILQPKLPITATKVTSPRVTQKIKETIQKKVYGEFNNILLTEDEYQKLTERFGAADCCRRIDDLSMGIASKGYKYNSHYATILSWDRLEKKRNPVIQSPEVTNTVEDYEKESARQAEEKKNGR